MSFVCECVGGWKESMCLIMLMLTCDRKGCVCVCVCVCVCARYWRGGEGGKRCVPRRFCVHQPDRLLVVVMLFLSVLCIRSLRLPPSFAVSVGRSLAGTVTGS